MSERRAYNVMGDWYERMNDLQDEERLALFVEELKACAFEVRLETESRHYIPSAQTVQNWLISRRANQVLDARPIDVPAWAVETLGPTVYAHRIHLKLYDFFTGRTT